MLRRFAVSRFEPMPENFARAGAEGRPRHRRSACRENHHCWAMGGPIVELGGKCRRVDITDSIDEAGNVMAGSWLSQWPGSDTFPLTKQPKPP
jgi:hypothetical protein